MFQPFGEDSGTTGTTLNGDHAIQGFVPFDEGMLFDASPYLNRRATPSSDAVARPKKKKSPPSNNNSNSHQREQDLRDGDKSKIRELSGHEFRSRMYERFKKNGIIDSLKTQMRVQILNQMQQESRMEQPSNLVMEGDGDSAVRKRNLWNQAINGMIAHHLQKTQCTYTLSVFVSEANLRETAQMSDVDLLAMIGVLVPNTTDDYYVQIESTNQAARRLGDMYTKKKKQSESILSTIVNLFQHLITLQTHSIEVQTDKSASSIDSELEKLDENFLFELEQYKKKSVLSLEQRFAEYQAECDRRAREEIASKVKVFEETVVSTMRLQESAKYREKISQIRDDLEKSYLRKMERLSLRERQVMENLESKGKQLDRELFEHRQSMLREVEKLQLDRSALQKEIQEVEEKKRAMQKRMDEQSKNVEVRIARLTADMKSELNIMKDKLEREYSEQLAIVRQKGAELDRERETVTSRREDTTARETLRETMTALSGMKSQLEETRNRNRFLESQVEALSQQIQKLREDRVPRPQTHRVEINEILERKIQDLQDEKRILTSGLSDATRHIESLKISHTEEVEAMEDEIQESRLREKSMIIEIENLRQMLAETKRALDAALIGSMDDPYSGHVFTHQAPNRQYVPEYYDHYSWHRHESEPADTKTERVRSPSEPAPRYTHASDMHAQIEKSTPLPVARYNVTQHNQESTDQLTKNSTKNESTKRDNNYTEDSQVTGEEPTLHKKLLTAVDDSESITQPHQESTDQLTHNSSKDDSTRKNLEDHQVTGEENPTLQTKPEPFTHEVDSSEEDKPKEIEVVKEEQTEKEEKITEIAQEDEQQGHDKEDEHIDAHNNDSSGSFGFDQDDNGFGGDDMGFDSDEIYVETVDAYDDW